MPTNKKWHENAIYETNNKTKRGCKKTPNLTRLPVIELPYQKQKRRDTANPQLQARKKMTVIHIEK